MPSTNPNPDADAPPGATATTLPPNPEAPLRVHVSDSDPRAVAYIAGAAPNRLGVLADGRSLVEALLGTADTSKAPERWRHPLFPAVALSLLQEVANRRLFSVVRERLRGNQPPVWDVPTKLLKFSISVNSTSIRLIFGRIDCSRRVLEARRRSRVQTVRLRAH